VQQIVAEQRTGPMPSRSATDSNLVILSAYFVPVKRIQQ